MLSTLLSAQKLHSGSSGPEEGAWPELSLSNYGN